MRSIRPYIAKIKSSTTLSLNKMLVKPHFEYYRPLAVKLGDKATEEMITTERQAFKMIFNIGNSVKNKWVDKLMRNTNAILDQKFIDDIRYVINRTSDKNGEWMTETWLGKNIS